MLDLDRFSAVNNEYGHAVGDAVLRRVAKAIRGATREGDVVVRYGGEEFVVIAPATDGDGAVEAAERIRSGRRRLGRGTRRRAGRATHRLGRRRQPGRRDRRAGPVPGGRLSAARGQAGRARPRHEDLRHGAAAGARGRESPAPFVTDSHRAGVSRRRTAQRAADERGALARARERQIAAGAASRRIAAQCPPDGNVARTEVRAVRPAVRTRGAAAAVPRRASRRRYGSVRA